MCATENTNFRVLKSPSQMYSRFNTISQLQHKMEPDEQNYITDCNAVQSGKYLPTFLNNLHSNRHKNLKCNNNYIIDSFYSKGRNEIQSSRYTFSTRKFRVRDLIISRVICDFVVNHVNSRQWSVFSHIKELLTLSRFHSRAGARDLTLFRGLQISYGAYPASYTMGIRSCFTGGKEAGAWSWQIASI
jgi:hypothetical protein